MLDIKTIGGAVTIAGGAIAFLYREYKNKHKAIDRHNEKQDTAIHDVQDRTLVLETQMKKVEPDVSEIRSVQQRDGIRLATTEAGVAQIRGDVTEIKNMISTKLDRIPELIKELSTSFVPRNEIEARFAAVERENDKSQS